MNRKPAIARLKFCATRLKVRLMSEVPLELSVGRDRFKCSSRLDEEESSTPVKTFSIGFEEQDFSELHHARRVAEHVRREHHEFIVRPDVLEVLPTLVEHSVSLSPVPPQSQRITLHAKHVNT